MSCQPVGDSGFVVTCFRADNPGGTDVLFEERFRELTPIRFEHEGSQTQ